MNTETKLAPEADQKPAKAAPKMGVDVAEDGSITYSFASIGKTLAVKIEDFPQNVRDFFALFGMRTKLRNFTAAEAKDGEAITPEAMYERLAKGVDMLKAGITRAAAEPGEKRSGGTLFLEAAFIYRRMKAEALGAAFTETETEVAKALETLSEDQVKVLKATTLFKLAEAEAKSNRAAKALQAAKAAAAKEAANGEAAPF